MTLIEIMIVVIVIAVFTAVAVPFFSLTGFVLGLGQETMEP